MNKINLELLLEVSKLTTTENISEGWVHLALTIES